MAEEVKETREDFEAQLEESLNKASTNEDAVWNRLEQMKEDGDVLALTVGGVVNGGVIVYVEGIRGFIPASLLSTKYVEDLNVWLQKDVEAKIITVEPEEQRLVLSAKAVEKEKERKERENKINELKVGTVVEGTVENIMPYGAFVDIGDGISGLVHISQLSQKRVKSPEDVVKEGEQVTVKIIKVANGKVSLSIKALEDENTVAKQTIPSPGQFYAYFTGAQLLNTTLEIYGSEEAFAEDVIKAYGEFVQEIYAAGCRNLQFDDCVWGGMVDAKMAVALTGRTGQRLEDYKKLLLELNNQVVAQAPEDLVINTHVCRGNYHSTFFSSGAYDSVADLLFGEENVNAYYLEYDDKRSGGFAPLAKVSGDKKVVLGLITTKTPELEDKEKVIARIHEAAKYVPLDRLYLSPQCGFASCEIGNKLTEEEQWAKLKLVKEIADEVWSDR